MTTLKGRVLVADDESDLRALFSDILKELGCDLLQGFHCGRPAPFSALPADA